MLDLTVRTITMGPLHTMSEDPKTSSIPGKEDAAAELSPVENAVSKNVSFVSSSTTHRQPGEIPAFRQTRLQGISGKVELETTSLKNEASISSGTATTRLTSDGSAESLSPFAKPQSEEVEFVTGQTSPSWRSKLGSKLYGRNTEMEMLQKEYVTCLENPTRMIVLSGARGSGKTTLVQRSLQRCAAKGYFVMGKFDQLSSVTPYSAFVMAFDELVEKIQERGDVETEAFCGAVKTALGNQKSVLTSMIPSIHQILGDIRENSTDNVLSTNAEQTGTRFGFAVRALLRAFCSKAKPVVLFLDNMEYADSCSLDLLYSLAVDKENEGLILVVAAEESAGPDCFLPVRLRAANEIGFSTVKIHVAKLPEAAIRSMLNNVLLLDESDCSELAHMIFENTDGSMFQATLLLDRLQQKGILNVDVTSGMATVTKEKEKIALKNVSCRLLIMEQMMKLPSRARDVLKVASCLGSKFEVRLIQDVLGFEVRSVLDALVCGGMLHKDYSGSVYDFETEEIQRVAYEELTPGDQRGRLHVEVARRIWRKLSEDDLEKYVFLVLYQFHASSHLIKRDEEQEAVATLCLHAGHKAAKVSSFHIAAKHLELGLSVINSSDPRQWRNKYELMLALHNAAAEMHMCTANVERMDVILEAVFDHARTYSDKLQAFNTRIGSLSYLERQGEAVDLGVQVLKELGEPFPTRMCSAALLSEFKSVKKLLKGKTDEQLLRIPFIAEKTKLQCLQVLNVMVLPALMDRPRLTPFVMLKVMKITLQYGLSALASPSFAIYGMLCIVASNDFESALRFANLSLAVLEKFKSIEYLPRVSAAIYACIMPWIQPLKESMEPLLKAYQVGLETGDLEFSALCSNLYNLIGMETGKPLHELDRGWREFQGAMVLHRQGASLTMLLPHIQMIHHLMGLTTDPLSAKGDVIDFDDLYKNAATIAKLGIKECRMQLHFLFNDFQGASNFLVSRSELSLAPPSPERTTMLYYVALISIATARAGVRARRNVREARKCLKELKAWARTCPENFINKVLLVEAELASIQNKIQLAHEKYICAISLAQTHGFTQDNALALELFARHQFSLNRTVEARSNFEKACEQYEKWGALAKVHQLREHMNSLVPL